MEDLTGKQLGQYQVVEALGAGGMATVYKAYQPSMERYVALKILPRHMAAEPDFVSRFKVESKVIASLEHPNILPVYDFGEAEGYTYLVMRYVEGQTLNSLLRGEPLPTSEIQLVMGQISAALDYAHSRDVVHRDVKPSNVLLDSHGNCLLSDFGLAKVLISSAQLTASGAFLGTPKYASPEQCLGSSDIDQRSDIYSLGVILYEMATGRPPFDADTPMGVVIKHIHDPLPMPRTINADLPEAVERVILKALSKEVDGRYSTAGELTRAYNAAVEGLAEDTGELPKSIATQTPKAQPATIPGTPEKRAPSIPKKWIGAGILGLILLFIGTVTSSSWMNLLINLPSTPTQSIRNSPTAVASPSQTDTPQPIETTAVIKLTATPLPTDTKPPSSTPTPAGLPLLITDSFGVPMVLVPAGSFDMGSQDGESDEKPVHTVALDGFYIDQYEVTNANYAACVDAGSCDPPADTSSYTLESYFRDAAFVDYPVINVDWDDANEYCAWREARLPTEAEWEKAARGDFKRAAYPWGTEFNGTLTNYCDVNCSFRDRTDPDFDDGYGDTAPVGSYPPNSYDLYDVAGNVWEWTADWYGAGYYASSPSNNPQGPEDGVSRVLRGGSWLDYHPNLRVSFRLGYSPGSGYFNIGFRCARDIP